MLRRIAALLMGLLITVTMTAPFTYRVQAGTRMMLLSPASPLPPAGNAELSSVLTLTYRDNGSRFTLPLNTLIVLQMPVYGQMSLNFDPTILQITAPPLPIPDTDYSIPNITPVPGDEALAISGGWRLLTIGPGTTLLSVVNQPCPPGLFCSLRETSSFSVTITVEYPRYPRITPYPPYPPVPPSIGSNVYLSTAYLNQTITVQPGQTITLDLPFLTVGQSVNLQFDSTILQPLYAQYAPAGQGYTAGTTIVPAGGWQFRAMRLGTTSLTVSDSSCTNGGSDCSSPILFNVTIQVSSDAR